MILEQKLVLENESQRFNFMFQRKLRNLQYCQLSPHTQSIGEFEATTLRAVYSRNEIKHTDFLKIDVEGADFSVLKEPLNDRPVLCEFEDKKTKSLGHSWKTVCQYLIERGYTIFVSEWHPIKRYGIAHEWCGLWKYPCELSSHLAWGNLIAFSSAPNITQLEASMQTSLCFR